MEQRFGHDFSRVRVHADGNSATAARALNARAYTVGRDIAFGIGQYAPSTRKGKRLVAHELAHVVQQGESPRLGVNRKGAGKGAGPESLSEPLPIASVLHQPGVQRQTDGPESGQADNGQPEDVEPEEPKLTRSQEIALSRTSPGEITGATVAKPKAEHRAVIAELGRLLKKRASAR
jgi:hypothetical protein